jgi:glycine cleavage system H protein
LNIPDDLKYSSEHEWVRVEGEQAVIGVTDYAQDQLGDIVYLDLPSTGAVLKQFDKLGEIESVKAVSDLFAPVGGEVLEVNQNAVDSPELVNGEPYGRGWLVKLKLADPSEIDKLFDAKAYDDLITREMEDNTD